MDLNRNERIELQLLRKLREVNIKLQALHAFRVVAMGQPLPTNLNEDRDDNQKIDHGDEQEPSGD